MSWAHLGPRNIQRFLASRMFGQPTRTMCRGCISTLASCTGGVIVHWRGCLAHFTKFGGSGCCERRYYPWSGGKTSRPRGYFSPLEFDALVRALCCAFGGVGRGMLKAVRLAGVATHLLSKLMRVEQNMFQIRCSKQYCHLLPGHMQQNWSSLLVPCRAAEFTSGVLHSAGRLPCLRGPPRHHFWS